MDTTWEIGDLIWVPRKPMSLWSKVGDPDFWKMGIIISIEEYNCVCFFYNDHFEKIHVDHIRRVYTND
jgi:hypothetical protein